MELYYAGTCTMSINTYIRNNYGTKKAFLLHHAYRILLFSPYFSVEKNIDWSRVRRLVYVCMGNICRSPYAEVVTGRYGLPSASLGVLARQGKHANPAAATNALIRGYDLSAHRATAVGEFAVQEGDLLICMEPWHVTSLRTHIPGQSAQITLLGLWGNPRRPYLPDPYGKSDEYFTNCFSYIEHAVANIAARLQDDSDPS